MQCANPKCHCGLFDVPGGSIWLLQLELPRDLRKDYDEAAFLMPMLPQK